MSTTSHLPSHSHGLELYVEQIEIRPVLCPVVLLLGRMLARNNELISSLQVNSPVHNMVFVSHNEMNKIVSQAVNKIMKDKMRESTNCFLINAFGKKTLSLTNCYPRKLS